MITTTTQNGKRTNSLAFARSDCHTCAARGQKCDRQRPQCATCITQGRKCGGFATPLSWDDRRTWLGQSRRKIVAPDEGTVEEAALTASTVGAGTPKKTPPRGFRFVLSGKRDRKRRKVAPPSSEVQTDTPQLEYFASLLQSGSYTLPPEEPEVMDRASGEILSGLGLGDAFQDGLSLITSEVGPVEGLMSTLRTPALEPVSGAGPNQPLGNQHEALLQMYDTEFCVLPITSDTALNPFRCREPVSQGSKLLFHAILALCCRHLSQMTGTWSTEEREHRSQAFKLLDHALQSDQLSRRGHTLLDPLLVLFTLDCTLSASGKWTAYLTKALSILEACGGPSTLDNARIRSQVAMLIWWDATLALVSRHGTVFSQQYLEHLIRAEKSDRWSFYDLTGCPSDLVILVFKLAELAHQSTIASTMKWLTLDVTPIAEIEAQLRAWIHPLFTMPRYEQADDDSSSNATLDEATFHAHQDRHHCAEAWRYTLLLYIERIFRWDRSQPRPLSIPAIARLTLNHVRCCRRTSQTQKQLLLPVFVAGSETADDEMRDLVRSYCRWWGERSRYNMFHSVPVLLEDIWSGNKWWGEVVDEKTRAPADGSKVQFLFG
ncbi:fungal-specific transcription factor domain-containing protein [Aspergillus avenaceus]|uniref:Fungal-specific transcription factor domain-containing protein n=1 Tax=Aspergillus avenaceus TaxID=36643 RepID=A0A5N6TNH1_ASPAV|nr:fungal-specific transcription factor domain-containing protein [Aspergillus avenaceus]